MTEAWNTPDLNDDNLESGAMVCTVQFGSYGGRKKFCGQAVTVRCANDNSLVRDKLENPGDGKVLVVDGGGSLHTALVGGNISGLAAKNGWSGILIYGAVRDIDDMAATDVGVFAYGRSPGKSVKQSAGLVDIPLVIGDAVFRPGDWVYCDENGVLVSPVRLDA